MNKYSNKEKPQLPNVSSYTPIPPKDTEYNQNVIEKDWDHFFNTRLGEDNVNPQIKIPTTQDMEDKNKEIEFQQNHIENLNLWLEDANEANRILNGNNDVLQVQIDNLTAQFNNLQLKVVIETSKLKDELDISEKNRKHVTDMFEQKDTILNEATKVINQLRNKLIQYDADKINAEHLAKQTIILKEENTKLKEQLTSKDLIIISSKKKLEESETSFAASKRNCENIQKAYDGNKDLIAMLNKYIFDKSIIIERLVKNLTDITKAGIFSRRDIAVKSLKNYEDFIINQNKIK